MCQGPDDKRCSWYRDVRCKEIAPNEYLPSSSGENGVICTQTSEGWCNAAFEAVSGNKAKPTCLITVPVPSLPTMSQTTGPLTFPTATVFISSTRSIPSAATRERTLVYCWMWTAWLMDLVASANLNF